MATYRPLAGGSGAGAGGGSSSASGGEAVPLSTAMVFLVDLQVGVICFSGSFHVFVVGSFHIYKFKRNVLDNQNRGASSSRPPVMHGDSRQPFGNQASHLLNVSNKRP